MRLIMHEYDILAPGSPHISTGLYSIMTPPFYDVVAQDVAIVTDISEGMARGQGY